MTSLLSFLAISFCRKDHPVVVGAELAAETMRSTPIELQSGVCFEVRIDAPFQVREVRH